MQRNTFKVVEEEIKEQKRQEEEPPLKEFNVYWSATCSGTTRVMARDEEEAREEAYSNGCPDNYDTDDWEINGVEERIARQRIVR